MKSKRRNGKFEQGCVLSESYTATDALLPILPACRQPLLPACVFIARDTIRHPRLFFPENLFVVRGVREPRFHCMCVLFIYLTHFALKYGFYVQYVFEHNFRMLHNCHVCNCWVLNSVSLKVWNSAYEVFFVLFQFLMPCWNDSFVIAIICTADYRIHPVSWSLFYILQNHYLNKSCIVFETILPYIKEALMKLPPYKFQVPIVILLIVVNWKLWCCGCILATLR
jgi:hypothetical protein